MSKFTPTVKGLITGFLMVILFYIINAAQPQPTFLGYLMFLIYGAGIVWAVLTPTNEPVTFGKLLNNGFKCFVVATLVMAITVFIFYKMNPQVVEKMAQLTHQQLLQTEKNRTPAEIAEKVKQAKENYPIMAVYVTVFQYLLIGAVVTAATAGMLSLQKKN